MDFAKFVAFLDSKSLYFPRSDHLGDEFEFSYPQANYDAFKGTDLETNNEFFLWAMRTFGKTLYVSCWHANDHESTGMWAEYLKGQQGVAVQTSFSRLAGALSTCDYADRLDLGMVNYVDYGTQRVHDQRIQSFIFHKRIQFSGEREFRAVISLPMGDQQFMGYDPSIAPPETPAGLLIPIDQYRVVEKVIVSPKAQPWFTTLVASMMERYELGGRIESSSLCGPPLR